MPPDGETRRGRGADTPDPAHLGDDAPSQGGGFFRGSAPDPRPLTATARSQLQGNLAPILRDITATGAILPEVQEEAHEDLGADVVSAWVQGPDGIFGSGIRVDMHVAPEERLADIAEQLQEWEMEELAAAGRPATWPECPEHPNSHPLSPQVRNGVAMWCCPRTGNPEYPIGAATATR